MSQSLPRQSLAILLCAVGISPASAAPSLLISPDAGSLVQPAKTQCYTTEVCIRWRRNPPPHPGSKCLEWTTKKVCEPHVYNNPNKPSEAAPRVRVPELIAKPKPWQFQRQPGLALPSSIGRSPSFKRR